MSKPKAQRIAVTVSRDAAALADPAQALASAVDLAPTEASLVQAPAPQTILPVAPLPPAAPPPAPKAEAPVDTRPVWQRDDPKQNDGQALRDIAYKAGISRSECERLTDEQIRQQMLHLTFAAFED